MSLKYNTVVKMSYRLQKKERDSMRNLIDEAVATVKVRDIKVCTEFVLHALKTRALPTLKLR